MFLEFPRGFAAMRLRKGLAYDRKQAKVGFKTLSKGHFCLKGKLESNATWRMFALTGLFRTILNL